MTSNQSASNSNNDSDNSNTVDQKLEYSDKNNFMHKSVTYKLSDDKLMKDEYKKFKVRQGDSLIRIAFMFDNSISHIKKINNLHGDDIYPG